VDISKINHLSLCSGYGGIDLGLRRALGDKMRTVAYAEIEAFAIELLLARMENGQLDEAPIWPDLRSFPWEEFVNRISILSGGYPCQPFSTAGRRQGANDARHIWPFIRNGIAIINPTVCFFENVEGHISMGLSSVISDLEEMGYRVAWGIFSASEVGAPHQRKRVFILANSKRVVGDQGRQLDDSGSNGHGKDDSISTRRESIVDASNCVWPSRPGQPQCGWEPPRVVGNSSSTRLEGRRESTTTRAEADSASITSRRRKTKSTLGRDADGTPSGMDYAELCVTCDNRTDELRLLGNGVVPATAEKAFITLLSKLNQTKNNTMNPSTLAHIIQQLIAAQEENDALIEECARLNQLLHPVAEQPEIEQEPEIEQQQPEIEQQPEQQEPEATELGAATSISLAWPIIAHANEEAKQ